MKTTLSEGRTHIEKKTTNKETRILFISSGVFLALMIALPIFLIQKEKRLRKELLENGIETVGVITKVYLHQEVREDDRNGRRTIVEWRADYSFVEMETQEIIYKENGLSEENAKNTKPGFKYRVRYLAGKAERTARIYFDEPIDSSIHKTTSSETQ